MENLRQPGQVNNHMCDGCYGNAARVYCECAGNRIYLCETCISGHIGKSPNLRHELIPAEVKVSSISAYRDRSDGLTKGKKELEESLGIFDQCREALIAAVEDIVWTLTEYLDYQLTYLQTLKETLAADIEKSVKEAESTLGCDAVEATQKYTQCLRHYEKDCLRLFEYEISPVLAEFCLEHMPRFSLLRPGQYRRQLVRLNSNHLETFNFETEKWSRPVRLFNKIKVDRYSTCTHIDTNRLFCCGFNPLSVTSMNHAGYIIGCSSGSIEELPPLQVRRASPGVLHHEGELFVFGSNLHTALVPANPSNENVDGKEVEMMQLAGREWTRLPSMPTVSQCSTPCVHLGSAYLCNGTNAFIDVLELRSRRFLDSLPIKLPPEKHRHSAIAIVADELILITFHHVTTLNLLQPALMSSQEHREVSILPVTSLVQYGKRIYWVNSNRECMRVSGYKYEIVESIGK